jgi:hypothetical protein
MARSYPRFLFSNPKNTKTKGPFIVHLLYPKMICGVYNTKTYGINCFVIEQFEGTLAERIPALSDMRLWMEKQLKDGEFSL